MEPTRHLLTTSFDGLVGFLPRLIAGLVILVLGYIVAKALARVAFLLLRRTAYDRFLGRLGVVDDREANATGVTDATKNEARKREAHPASRWTSQAVFVVVMLIALMQASVAWNLVMLSDGIARLLAYAPHLLGAIVIFAGALYFGNWTRDRLARGEGASFGQERRSLVASSVRAGILTLGAFMAMRELQIAPGIVTIAFAVTLSAIALAAALAFGLGSRGVAAQMTQDWYTRRGSARDGARRDQPHGERPSAP